MTKNPFQKFIAMLSEDRRDIMYLYAYALFYAIVNLSLPLGVQAIIGLIQAGMVSTSWIILRGTRGWRVADFTIVHQ